MKHRYSRVLSLLLLGILTVGADGCDWFSGSSAPKSVAPGAAPLIASFRGEFVPPAASVDGSCILTVTATSQGGYLPHSHVFSAPTLQAAGAVADNFPGGPTIVFRFPEKFHSSSHQIGLVTTDNGLDETNSTLGVMPVSDGVELTRTFGCDDTDITTFETIG